MYNPILASLEAHNQVRDLAQRTSTSGNRLVAMDDPIERVPRPKVGELVPMENPVERAPTYSGLTPQQQQNLTDIFNAVEQNPLNNPVQPLLPPTASEALTQHTNAQQARTRDFFNPVEDRWLASYHENPNLDRAREQTNGIALATLGAGNVGRSARTESRYGGGNSTGNMLTQNRLNWLNTTAGAVGQLNNARMNDIDRRDRMASGVLNASLAQTRKVTDGLTAANGLEQARQSQLDNLELQQHAIDSQRRAQNDAERDALTGELVGIGVGLLQDDDFIDGILDLF